MAPYKKRERKHKVRKKETKHAGSDHDPNAVEILPPDQATRKRKHEEARENIRSQQPNMSSKKKKRLDHYIDTKLRKEENLELLKKLGSAKFDTSLLRSSKDISRQKASKRSVSKNAPPSSNESVESDEDLDVSTPDSFAPGSSLNYRELSDELRDERLESTSSDGLPAQLQANQRNAVLGSGLKRPLQVDDTGNPVIKRRQRLSTWSEVAHDPQEIPWDGFDSEAEVEDGIDASGTTSSGSESDPDPADSEEEGSNTESESDESDSMPLFSFAQYPPKKPPSSHIVPRANSEFKVWATQQMNEAKDFTPSAPVVQSQDERQEAPVGSVRLRSPEQDPLPQELHVDADAVQRKAFSVQVARKPEIEEARSKLPIVAEEQKIMEAIHNNPVVIVCGATGSGKTTQVPQFLYEAGYGSPDSPNPGMVGVTQPRRVAAVTMARRVGEELGNVNASSYQIRFDSTVGKKTAIKFMTDGILLREISQDFILSRYSAIVIDEAHERSVNTDILIAMVSRIVDLRARLSKENAEVKPLKLIIMSATLMTDAFLSNSNLFPRGKPPLVESEGRQYPVTMHFARRTQRQYLDDAFTKITRGHRKLPPGGMLVFLTGQSEIIELAKRLSQKLQVHQTSQTMPGIKIAAKNVPLEVDDMDLGENMTSMIYPDEVSGNSEDEEKEFEIEDFEEASSKALILPLYSQLPTQEQLRVFEPPPENTRPIILATNVAETSITIPGIRYVIDCGRSKEKVYDETSSVQTFQVAWISKASATQRAGRAGRTGPGHCYRLYSSAVYERDFAEHTTPEILRSPVEGIVLQLKSMDLRHTINFPFPTPPDRQAISKAERILAYLGALDQDGKVTPLGRDLSIFPLGPRFAKMLAIGHQHECIHYTVAVVAALAIPELFVPEPLLNLGGSDSDGETYSNVNHINNTTQNQKKQDYNKTHHAFSAQDRQSDALKLLSAFCAYMWASNSNETEAFCTSRFLRTKAMKESLLLYRLLLSVIAVNHPGSVDISRLTLLPPSNTQIAALKQIVAAGFIDQVAIRADLYPQQFNMPRSPKRAIDVPYLTLFPTHEGKTESLDSLAVFIHPSSVLAHSSTKDLPQYLVYSHLQRSIPSTIAGSKIPKTRMHPLTAVTGMQLSTLAKGTPLLEYGKPVGKVLEVEGERDKRIAWVVPSMTSGSGAGGRAWPLPALKVLQKRDARGSWVVERIER